jgi:muconate cycloisomerase
MASLLKLRAFRFPEVKLKVGAAGAVQAAARARRVLGRRTDIRVDANMAWTVDRALDLIPALGRFGIESFEQPVAAADIAGLARLVARTPAQVIVDEGFTDRASLARLIACHAATGVNVRISKCGGLVAARARCLQALEAGLTLHVGCQVGESSLLSAAQVALLSGLPPAPAVRHIEGCFGRHLLRVDPSSPRVQFRYGGRPPSRPRGPGLGVDVEESSITRWAVDQAVIF